MDVPEIKVSEMKVPDNLGVTEYQAAWINIVMLARIKTG